MIKPETFDPILKLHHANISSFSYVLAPIKNDAQNNVLNTKLSDSARIINLDADVFGAQPSIFETLNSDFIDIQWRSQSALSLGE